MKELSVCPYCQGDFLIKEVHCQTCNTSIRSDFKVNRFHIFGTEDLLFIELFLKNEGNIKAMERDLGVSYPSVKGRLKQIIKALGYQSEESASTPRMAILNDLSKGKISVSDAIKSLGDGE